MTLSRPLIAVFAVLALAGCASSNKITTRTDPEPAAVTSDTGADTTADTARPVPTTSPETTATAATTTTAAAPAATEPVAKKGSRDNPLQLGELSTFGDYESFTVTPVETVDPATISGANQFNDEAGAGQMYVRVGITGTYGGDETGSAYDFSTLGLVGDKGKIYDTTYLADMDGALESLIEAPDVIEGGTITGFMYYLADNDDGNFLIISQSYDGNQFIDVSP